MPATVAAWVVSAFAASGAYAAVVYAVVYVAVSAAIYYGASLVLRNNQKNPSFINDAANRTQMVRQAAAARRIVYGQVKLSGPLAYIAASGSSNEYVHLVILLATHEVQEIGDIYLNDEVVPLDGSGNATGKYAGFVRVKKHLGTAGDAADSDLVSESAGAWTSAHTLSSIAYLYVRCKFDATLFSTGMPNFAAVVKGRKVYDPRSATTGYSTNAALCIYDYMTDTKFGLGALAADVDLTEIQAAANVCDEAVTLSTVPATSMVAGTTYTIATLGTTNFTSFGAAANTVGTTFVATAAGTGTGTVSVASALTESRYTVNGTVDTSEKPGNILEALLSAMAGRIVFAGGKWFIQAGAYRTPTVTITESELRGGISIQTKLSRRELVNGVKGVFVSPANNWQADDFPPVFSRVAAGSFVTGKRYTILEVGTTNFTAIGAASNTVGVSFTATGAGSGTGKADQYLGEDDGERCWLDVQLPYTTSGSMAQRLAKISLERSRRQITVKNPCMLHALKVQAGDNIMQSNTRMGWSSKVFEVTEFQFTSYDDSEGNPSLGIDLVQRETDSNVWVWAAEDITLPQAPTTNLYNPAIVPTPTGLTLLSDGTTLLQQNDGTVVPRLKVSWTAPSDQFVKSGGLAVIEYKDSGSGTWKEWTKPRGDLTEDFITDVVVGQTVDVRMRFMNVLGVFGAYCSTGSCLISGKTSLPTNPTSVTPHAPSSTYPCQPMVWVVSGGIMYSSVITFTDSADKDVVGYEFATHTSNSSAPSFAGFFVPAGVGKLQYDTGLLTPQYLWYRARNRSGTLSAYVYSGYNMNAYVAVPSGNMIVQNANDVNVSGVKTGAAGASSVRQVAARYPGTIGYSLTGGSPTETFNIDISNRGFNTKPDAGFIHCYTNYNLVAYYAHDAGGNSSTNAVVFVSTIDGTNIPAGVQGFSFEFVEHN